MVAQPCVSAICCIAPYLQVTKASNDIHLDTIESVILIKFWHPVCRVPKMNIEERVFFSRITAVVLEGDINDLNYIFNL